MLTGKQKQILEIIAAAVDEQGCPPTLREISERMGIKGTATAIAHLDALERKGYVRRRSGSRGITLVGRSAAAVAVPLAGCVRAGTPESAVEDIQGYHMLDSSWLKGGGCFLLRVRGDSMIEAHIMDGDLALIRPQPTADNGEIVVAVIDGEATLKRFYRETGQIRLQPENSGMQPIIVRDGEAETMIVGKLLRTIRVYE